jgi:hypothetical protein
MFEYLMSLLFVKSPEWRIYTPKWSRSVTINGVRLSMDEYRFERRWDGEKYEYRAIRLSVEEMEDMRAW